MNSGMSLDRGGERNGGVENYARRLFEKFLRYILKYSFVTRKKGEGGLGRGRFRERME